MECVQVLDKSGKVVYVFESFGSAVHIGRDKKKCAIALPVDAQGVSRVHGSLAWSGQGELTFSDTSTYGTLVDGTLVKATNKAVNDKSHILVGDVELIISFVPQTSTNTSSSNSSTAFLKGSSAKRKSVLTDSLSNEKKRSKLDPPQSRKISSFFQKGSNTTEDDTLMVLAEDTPRSQSSTSRKGTTQNLISFVSDSVRDPPDGKSTLSNVKTDNQSAAKNELSFSATAVPRRKKQCIFDVNKRNVSRQSLSVIVEDTQLKPTTCNEFNSKKATAKAVNVTCVADTCEQSTSSCSLRAELMTSNAKTFENATSNVTEVDEGDVLSLPYKTERLSSKDVSEKSVLPVPVKKARVLDLFPSQEAHYVKLDDTANVSHEVAKDPDLSDILKVVSTGKQYDNSGDAEDSDEEKGLEIARVVSKLSQLVHYADIERVPKRPTISWDDSDHRAANFKRFKKARQGRFNTSLSSANLSCMVAGNADLVDFRQLS